MRYRFGNCLLDDERHEFLADGTAVSLEPQVFDLLALLARKPGMLISRDDLLAEIWHGRIVSESTISARISAARRAVGDDGKAQRIIRTIARRGIQMAADVEASSEASGKTHPSGRQDAQHVRFARSRDGTGIAYATTGSGPPLLRSGHWLTHLEQDWRSQVWHPLLSTLGESFSVTRYDQRSTGLSDWQVENLGLGNFSDDMHAVAEAAGLQRFPIFAASQGVPVAIDYAIRHPQKVSRLILYGGFAQGRFLRLSNEEKAKGDAFLTLIREGWGRAGSPFVSAFSTVFMPDGTPEQLQSFVDMQLASASPENAVRLRQTIDMFDVSDRLAEVRVPTLVVHARNDAVQPLEEARKVASGIAGAELLVLESRNHVPLPQDPEWPKLIAAIREFAAG